jgi:hypothetical protein
MLSRFLLVRPGGPLEKGASGGWPDPPYLLEA